MYHIKKMNAIADVINRELDDKNYQISDAMENEHAIILRSADLHDMEFSPNLMAISRAGAGTNNIPIERCSEAGIAVFNTPGANANAVKELVLAAMIIASRNLLEGMEWVETLKGQGDAIPKLTEKGKNQFVGPELSGKNLGVIGLGAIGVMVANAGHAINMNVYGYDPFLSVSAAWGVSRAIIRANSVDELLAKSDYVTIHIPSTDQTRGSVNKEYIAKMKDGATLLNFARGDIVNADDVVEAVKSGKLHKYVTDFPEECYLGVKNIVCVPHLGASTPESEENCAQMAAHQLNDYLMYGNITNSVNLPYCHLPYTGRFRITVIHRNQSNMVGQITAVLARKGANISDMINKSSKDYAYTILDLDDVLNGDLLDTLYSIDGVIKVRLIPPRV
ncbi:phosphoglycerate dehydrogenase [Clostridia bacterium OttesenSCG-928-F22]|nr:phosphoglycerate dehydrogenase [Clostridia bacterium OttesenSCG-928-F22]